MRLVLALALSAAPLIAQPVIADLGVVNAASFLPPTVPGGAIARGSIFSVFGEELAAREAAVEAFPIEETLGGVRLELAVAGGDVFTPLPLYVSAGQINALMPSAVPVGEHFLTVFRDGEASNTERVKIVRASIGLFHTAGSFFHYPSPAGTEMLDAVRPGGRLTLWATGLGPIEASDALAAPVGEIATDLTITVGDKAAEILYQGRSSCCSGLDQIEVVLAEDTPEGCFVPVWATVGGSLHSNIGVVSVAAEGRACWQNEETLSPAVIDGPTGRMVFAQVQDASDPTLAIQAAFAAPSEDGAAISPFAGFDLARLPPRGVCLPGLGEPPLPTSVELPVDWTPSYRRLDGGERFEVETPSGPSTLTPAVPISHPLRFAADPPFELLPGLYEIESEGGEGFPSFRAEAELEAPPLWLNRDSAAYLRDDWTVDWSGGGAGEQLVSAQQGCPPNEEGTAACVLGALAGLPPVPPLFVCRAASEATGVAVPEAFFANSAIEDVAVYLHTLHPPVEMQFETDGPETGQVIFRDAEGDAAILNRPHLPSTPVTLPNGATIQAELATSPAETQRGLMFRTELGSNEGMLFHFTSNAVRRFWMLNTLIPLDIIWLNEDREVLFISRDTPPCESQACPTYGPGEASRFVLELPAGEAARRGLQVGDRLDW